MLINWITSRRLGWIYKNMQPTKTEKIEWTENHEEIERSITSKGTESVIKNLLTNKHIGPDRFTGDFYQTLKRINAIFFSNSSSKIREGGILQNSF